MKSTIEIAFASIITAVLIGFLIYFLMNKINGDKNVYEATIELGTEGQESTEDNQDISDATFSISGARPIYKYIGGTLNSGSDYDTRTLFKVTYKNVEYLYDASTGKWKNTDTGAESPCAFIIKIKGAYNRTGKSIFYKGLEADFDNELLEYMLFYDEDNYTITPLGSGAYTLDLALIGDGNYQYTTINIPVK